MVAMVDRLVEMDMVDILVFVVIVDMLVNMDPVKAYTVHMVDIDDMVMEDNGDEVDYVDLVHNTHIVDMLNNNE